MKLCNTCGNIQEDSCFHKRSSSKDVLTAKCKSCQKEYDKARLNKPDRVVYRKKYYLDNKDKVWYKELHHKSNSKYRENNSAKYKAHIAVNNAIRDRILFKESCEVCGDPEVHGHHDDYSIPLGVRWLCNTCHKEWHVINGEGINGD